MGERERVGRLVAQGRQTLGLLRRVVALVRAEDVTFLAAGIAYYTLVSVFPFLLLVVAVGTALGGEALAEQVVATSRDVLSPGGEGALRDVLTSEAGRAPATLVSLALLTWSTLKVFRGLDIAFSRIYGTSSAGGFFDRARDAVVALGAVALAVVSLLAAGVIVNALGVTLGGALGTLSLVVVLSVVFLPLFYLFPDADVTVREVVPGTVFAACGWALLGTAFGAYARLAGGASLYGAVGAVLLLVTWFYVGSIVILAGATLNAARSGVVASQTGTNKSPPADTSPNERS